MSPLSTQCTSRVHATDHKDVVTTGPDIRVGACSIVGLHTDHAALKIECESGLAIEGEGDESANRLAD